MTIQDALDQVDLLTPNQIPPEQKIRWLSALDGIVYHEVFQTHEILKDLPFCGYDEETPLLTPLLVNAPYDEVYRWYLEMKIQDVNGEMARYNNAVQKYNTAMLALMDAVNRDYPPATRLHPRFY